jgi:hypothetical protein
MVLLLLLQLFKISTTTTVTPKAIALTKMA